jgi:hypothetical protein
MAITAGFVEMKILNEAWNGKTYYIEAQMTVDPKEVSQRVAEILDGKQKEKELEGAQKREREERVKVEQARAEAEKKELERQKAYIAKVEAKEKEMEEAKHYQVVVGLDFGLMVLPLPEYTYGFLSVGSRCTKNISPNFGLDILKWNIGTQGKDHNIVNDDTYESVSSLYGQLLTGVRFATNRFGRNKNTYFYTSLRAGIGVVSYEYSYVVSDDPDDFGNNFVLSTDKGVFAMEMDAGVHFKYFFLGATINHNFDNSTLYTYFLGMGNVSNNMLKPSWGLRFGWDIGIGWDWRRKLY